MSEESEKQNKSKKHRPGYLTAPNNVQAANHLSYLFQVSSGHERLERVI